MTPRQVQALVGVGVVVAVLAVVLVVVLSIGWGDPEAAPTSLSTTTTASASTSTSVAEVTTTPAPTTAPSTSTPTTTSTSTATSASTTTTTTLPAGACAGAGAGPLPAGATIAAEVRDDFDGDGSDDRFLVYGDAPFTWWSRVELSYGYAAVGPASSCYEIAGARAVDLGGPAALAAVESVDSMALGHVVFYALRECGLDEVRQSDGARTGFLLRDGLLAKRGITCRADGIDVTIADSEDGIEWRAHTRTLYWDPVAGSFRPDPAVEFVLTLHSPEDDPAIQRYADWDC